jgi:hypothetical protein
MYDSILSCILQRLIPVIVFLCATPAVAIFLIAMVRLDVSVVMRMCARDRAHTGRVLATAIADH